MRGLYRVRGFSLAEILVTSSLFLVLLSIVVQISVTAMQRTRSGQTRIEIQQQGLFLLRQWERDLERTAPSAMRGYQGEASVVSMTPMAGPGQDGYPLWFEQLVAYVYHQDQKVLRRLVFYSSTPPFVGRFSPSRPLLPTPAELQLIAQSTVSDERVLSRDVEEFYLADSKGSQNIFNEQTLHLRLKLGKDSSYDSRRAEFTIERRYALRNRY